MAYATAPYTDLPKFKSKLEEDYYHHLHLLMCAQEIQGFCFEKMTFTIGVNERGNATRYTPDFLVINERGEVEYHETKGSKHARGQTAALARLHSAAMQFPYFRWFLVMREDREWVYREVRKK